MKADKSGFVSRNIGLAIVSVITICFVAVKMHGIYGFLIFPDEFTYWAYAAYAAGYDWSGITSLGSYFSYGYGFILFPIFTLCKDAVIAYRIAVGFNYILLILSYALLTHTMRKIIPDTTIPVEAFCAVTILVPWNLFYAQMTLTETFLICLYIILGSLLLYYLEKNKLWALVLLMLTLVYTYMVHMRTVGILLSVVCILLLHIFIHREKRWHFLIVIGMAAVLLIIATAIKKYALTNVYGGIDPTLAADNDYEGQVEKLKYICTREGFYDFIITILGGILYLGLATFGLFYWGTYMLIRYLVRLFVNLKKKVTITVLEKFAVFVLLSVVSQIVIATIYLLQRGEVDDYTYGRYSELIVPFVMVFGFTVLWKERCHIICIVTGICAVVHVAVIWLVVRQVLYTDSNKFLGYYMVGISYLYHEVDYSVERFYAGVWLMGELFTLTVTAAILIGRSGIGKRSMCFRSLAMIFAVVELSLAVHSDNLYLMPFKNAAFRDSRLTDKITALAEDERRILYMNNSEQAFIGIIQFMARDMDIQVVRQRDTVGEYKEIVSEDDILIFAFDDRMIAEWCKQYEHEDIYGHFTLLYNDR